jgi:hypothetical protein
LGIVPPSSAWTAAGNAGFAGGGRFRNGSPDRSTPSGADVQLLTAPPDVWISPTTSHCGALSTPLPASSTASLGQSESTWTVPFVETIVPGAPLILFVPQPCGSSARREYGSATSPPVFATAFAPTFWFAIPRTPAKNDGRSELIVTWTWLGIPENADGKTGGTSTRTWRPFVPST